MLFGLEQILTMYGIIVKIKVNDIEIVTNDTRQYIVFPAHTLLNSKFEWSGNCLILPNRFLTAIISIVVILKI